MKNTVLVTGARGQLGSFLVKELLLEPDLFSTVFGIDIDDVDLTHSSLVDTYMSQECFKSLDVVIHCAAATNTTAIEQDPSSFYAANVLAARNLARWCAAHGKMFIFISTDYVLSELSPIVDGELQEFPVSQYGLQKLLAEREVMLAYKDSPSLCAILRSSWMYGNSDRSFVEKLLKAIAAGSAANAASSKPDFIYSHSVADDAYGCPTHVKMLKAMIVDIVKTGKSGIHECFSRTLQMNRYEWASIIWKCFMEETRKARPANEVDMLNLVFFGIALKPAHSSGTGMRHPGKLKTFECSLAELNGMSDPLTHEYIAENIQRLAKMFIQTAKLEDRLPV